MDRTALLGIIFFCGFTHRRLSQPPCFIRIFAKGSDYVICTFYLRIQSCTYLPTIMPDPTTQSNYLSITTEHVAFEWNVDFVSKVISGSALHTLRVNQDGVDEAMSVATDILHPKMARC